MSRAARIVRNTAIGVALVVVAVIGAALLIVHTSRFQDWARQRIVAAVAEATGGKTEIGSLVLDAAHLHARIANLVIHGSEPSGTAPFVRIAQIDLTARLFSEGRILAISYLGVQQPEVNVLVYPDGSTNMPTPKPSAPSKTTPLETIVDLAIGHFELAQGNLTLNDHKQPLDITANNLRAQLWYRVLQADYTGRLSMEPVYVVSGRNTPVTYRITMPLALARNRIGIDGTTIATASSRLSVNGSLENLRQPEFSGRVDGWVTLADLDHTLGLNLDASARGLPDVLQLNVNASASAQQIRVASLALDWGRSQLQAGGNLKGGGGSLQFQGSVDLAEFARLARLTIQPQGSLLLNGDASLNAANSYRISGHMATRDLALRQGSLRVPSAAISTDVLAEPASLKLNELHVAAFGGEFSGSATLQDFAHYHLAGGLRNFDIQGLAQLAGERLPYSGTLSGPVQATGDLHVPGTRSIEAQANLAISPGTRGIPLRGRLEGVYQGASDNLRIENSTLELPHTRVALAGSTDHGLRIALVTTDLHDLLAAAPGAGPSPVALASGQAGFTGTVTGSLHVPRIAGQVSATHFQVEGRPFTSAAADVAASPSGLSVANGTLARGAMSAAFSGSVGMHAWKPGPHEPLAVDLSLQNGDVADLLAMAGQPPAGYSGAVTAAAHVTGTVGDPAGSVALHAAQGTLAGEPFDRLDAQIGLTDRLATIQQASLVAGNARVDLTGRFQHPRDSFTEGSLQASLRTNQVDLAKLPRLPETSGQLQLTAAVAGSLGPVPGDPAQTEFLVSSVQADASVRTLRYQGQPYGDFQTTIQTSGQTATTNLTSNFAGSNVRVRAATQLVPGYPTTAEAQVAGLPVERVLAIAGHGDIPVSGKLSATAQMRGTLAHPLASPEGSATLDLTGATVDGQPLDRLQAQATSTAQTLDLTRFEAVSGPSHIALTARFDHPAGQFDAGTLQFHIENGHLDLARLRSVQNARPGLAGTVEIAADGSAVASPGAPPFRLTNVNANISAAHVAAQGKNLGGFTLAAHTAAANRVDFILNSDLAGATIQAHGTGQLGANYPVNAELSFTNVKWSNLENLLESPSDGPPDFEITAEGKASVNGPLLQTASLQGSLDVSRLELQTVAQPHAVRSITIQNQGPIEARLDRGTVTLTGFHLTGPQTDVRASGSAALHGGSLNLSVNAGVDLAILQNFSRDIDSSGKITLAAAVRGTVSNPLATGSLQLQNASINYAAIPNGLSNANGTIALQGNRASIQNLTAESGGGKVVLSGFAMFGSQPRFALRAAATNVRVLVQEGVTIAGNADLRIAGVPDDSTATGAVTLTQLNYSPQSDLGSILTRAAPDVESTSVPNPLLDHMKLDIRVRTSVGMLVRSSLAENLQTDADLRVGGSASQPTILGRVNLEEGHLLFFGNTYTVNSGSIAFANPVRIEPILNLSLQTQTKGVTVVLNVTGPIDNMKLTYTSDPPLQFQEIAALLSTGSVPTSDPTLLANQPAQPAQTFEQSGESAILGQAVANPVANRLQRVFGVSQLTIDPAFTGASALPTAQVTLQQRVSTNITFTYTSALDDPNSTLIAAEWALNPRWSARALRDQNGIVSVNLLYKRQFR
ncbi:MAG TPA: translocation/assembly module TamB domain-containing protein [Bryobacteraceae bacterium]|nr:translocation/assembly module TamB domain-containing protein [Bryobacteraceae bacterium]